MNFTIVASHNMLAKCVKELMALCARTTLMLSGHPEAIDGPAFDRYCKYAKVDEKAETLVSYLEAIPIAMEVFGADVSFMNAMMMTMPDMIGDHGAIDEGPAPMDIDLFLKFIVAWTWAWIYVDFMDFMESAETRDGDDTGSHEFDFRELSFWSAFVGWCRDEEGLDVTESVTRNILNFFHGASVRDDDITIEVSLLLMDYCTAHGISTFLQDLCVEEGVYFINYLCLLVTGYRRGDQ